MEQLELDPTYVDISADKNYTSVREFKEDQVEFPIYFDWVTGRIPAPLFDPNVKSYIIAWVHIMIAPVLTAVAIFRTQERVDAHMKAWLG